MNEQQAGYLASFMTRRMAWQAWAFSSYQEAGVWYVVAVQGKTRIILTNYQDAAIVGPTYGLQ